METKLADLQLKPWLLAKLKQLGYEVVGDMQHLPAEEILRIPGMGGHAYRKIAKALGQDPDLTKR
ncbi:hypothetical protein CN075_32045 [Sinorhizobium meliloti]|uniref:hypothetical protein n=1 Tax=Rhizobium meliloti TaxID=382 RepID=UPI000FD7DB59|nr:hypothetical protein [Sinorhizobium meliloti]RVP37267.1 hypothetical protein CN075_32045 [Sinorhizobium meliloti]